MATLKPLSKGLFLLLVVALAMSCAHRKPQETGAHARAEKAISHPEPTPQPQTGIPTRPPEPPQEQSITALGEDYANSGMCEMIHFDYDKSNIKEIWQECLNNIAEYFIANPNLDLIVEGHADERGTREYNLALGERRAESTMTYLVNHGLDPNRITIRSWGEDRPIATCHNESCWQQNRRAEFYFVRQSR